MTQQQFIHNGYGNSEMVTSSVKWLLNFIVSGFTRVTTFPMHFITVGNDKSLLNSHIFYKILTPCKQICCGIVKRSPRLLFSYKY